MAACEENCVDGSLGVERLVSIQAVSIQTLGVKRIVSMVAWKQRGCSHLCSAYEPSSSNLKLTIAFSCQASSCPVPSK
jgi:hypothetical protein